MDFGMKLQNLRKAKGLSQEALAEQLNVSRQAVSKWESGAGYPEMDKLILLSQLFQVTLDYLVKDNQEAVPQGSDEKQFLSHQKIEEYIAFKNQFALRIGLSVMVIILSVNIPMLFDKTQHEDTSAFGMLIIIGFAVAMLIMTGMSSEHYTTLEKNKINMSFQDLQDIQEKYVHFQSTFRKSIAIGVFMIILSVAISGYIELTMQSQYLAGMILISIVACSVFIFIYQGIRDSMYRFLVQNETYIKEQKKEEKSLFAFTMPLAAMIYLFIGLVYGWWHPGWLVFPVVAIITTFIEKLRENEE